MFELQNIFKQLKLVKRLTYTALV